MIVIWDVVHRERRALIDDLVRLTPEQWNTPSGCAGWTIHDVLAHLVDDAKTTKLGFALSLMRARFNFDRLNQNGVEQEKQPHPLETLEAFRAVSDRSSSAPAPLASRLVEIIVHSEDIRRPLGIQHPYPIKAIIEAIKYQLATSGSMGGSKDRAQGLHLVATEADWSHGIGEEVHGHAIDLLLALTGREVPDDALSGAGAATLRNR